MRNFIICVFAFIMWGCTSKIDDGYLCKYFYFPTSNNANCFWVEVKEDRTMKVTFGDITWDCHHGISYGRFPKEGIAWEKIRAKDSIIIDTLAYRQLEDLSYEVRKKKSVNCSYKNKTIKDFIKKLKEISPIPIRGSWGSSLYGK